MSKGDWLDVGEDYDEASAILMSRLLSFVKMPRRVVPQINVNYASPRNGPFRIWVAPENLEEATCILAEKQVSDGELDSEALRDAPPDDA